VFQLPLTFARHRERPSKSKRDISAVQEPRHERSFEMLKPHSGQDATGPDVRQVLGGLDDGTVIAILRLHPTVAQLEEVRLRLNGEDDDFKQRQLGGVVAEILDMLKVDEEEPPSSPRR
jgi:hypothetical protein